jgi:hypothetical protein
VRTDLSSNRELAGNEGSDEVAQPMAEPFTEPAGKRRFIGQADRRDPLRRQFDGLEPHGRLDSASRFGGRWHVVRLSVGRRAQAQLARQRSKIMNLARAQTKLGNTVRQRISRIDWHRIVEDFAVLLSLPGEGFTGGEFVLTEQRPRMQSRVSIVPLRRGRRRRVYPRKFRSAQRPSVRQSAPRLSGF